MRIPQYPQHFRVFLTLLVLWLLALFGKVSEVGKSVRQRLRDQRKRRGRLAIPLPRLAPCPVPASFFRLWRPVRVAAALLLLAFAVVIRGPAATAQTHSASFDGTAQYLSIASNTDVSRGNASYTWAGWVYVNANSPGTILIGKEASGTGNQEFSVTLDNGGSGPYHIGAEIAYAAGSGVAVADTGYSVTTGQWVWFCYWHDSSGSTINIQVNSRTPVSVATTSALNAASSTPLTLGERAYTSFEGRLNGRLAAVGTWSRVLTATERRTRYGNGGGLYYASLPTGIKTGLTAWWDLQEASGNRGDSTGRGNALTSNGSVGQASGIVGVPYIGIMCDGDSTTAYTHDDASFYSNNTQADPRSYTGALHGLLSATLPSLNFSVSNVAVSGQSHKQMLANLAANLAATNPTVICLKTGLNDIALVTSGTDGSDSGTVSPGGTAGVATYTANIISYVNTVLAYDPGNGYQTQVVLITDTRCIEMTGRPYTDMMVTLRAALAAYNTFAGNPRVRIIDLASRMDALGGGTASAPNLQYWIRHESFNGGTVYVHESQRFYDLVEIPTIAPAILAAINNACSTGLPTTTETTSVVGTGSAKRKVQ